MKAGEIDMKDLQIDMKDQVQSEQTGLASHPIT